VDEASETALVNACGCHWDRGVEPALIRARLPVGELLRRLSEIYFRGRILRWLGMSNQNALLVDQGICFQVYVSVKNVARMAQTGAYS
jgi:hypothetical protein